MFLEPLLNEVTSIFLKIDHYFLILDHPRHFLCENLLNCDIVLQNIHTDIVKTFRGIHPDFMIEINQSCKDQMFFE